MLRPDYAGGGFANLIASIVEACGGAPRHAPLAALPAAELAQAGNVLLLLIDGLGDNYLRREGADGALIATTALFDPLFAVRFRQLRATAVA